MVRPTTDIADGLRTEEVRCRYTQHSPYRIATFFHNLMDHGWRRAYRDEIDHLRRNLAAGETALPDNVYEFKRKAS